MERDPSGGGGGGGGGSGLLLYYKKKCEKVRGRGRREEEVVEVQECEGIIDKGIISEKGKGVSG